LPRKRKNEVKVNNNESLEGLMQETYHDACLQINDIQRTINELTITANPDGVDDLTKIAKEKGNLLKVKDSAIRVKLEIAKLQSDIIKNRGDINTTIAERTDGKVSLADFKSIKQIIKNEEIDSEIEE